MILEIKSDRANWLVDFMVSNKKMFSLNPIIAGGSMLAVYRAIKLFDTDSKWAEFKRNVSVGTGYDKKKLDSFGDIDFWFHKKSAIYDANNEYNWLVSEHKDDKAYNQSLGKTIADSDIGLSRLMKTSGWANSFLARNKPLHSGENQFIKKGANSVKDLLSTFDYINCCVAWHDGVLYCDSRIDNAFESFELRLNSDSGLTGKSVAGRVFNALRAFKYAKRYNLDFDVEIANNIFNIYVDCKDIDYSAYNDKVVELEIVYGKRLANVETLRGMVDSLHILFDLFLKMKSFKQEYLVYLIDQADTLNGLKGAVSPVDDVRVKNRVYTVANIKLCKPSLTNMRAASKKP